MHPGLAFGSSHPVWPLTRKNFPGRPDLGLRPGPLGSGCAAGGRAGCPGRHTCSFPASAGAHSLEEVCLQVTDLLPGLRKLRSLLPEHGCLLLSPANFWQNDRERFHADPDIIATIHQHEPKTLQTSATLKGTPCGGCSAGRVAWCQVGRGGPGQRLLLLLQICCSGSPASTAG